MTYPLGMFPLSTVLFPEAGLPLHVFEERYRALMGSCLASDGEFGVVLIARGSEVGGGDQRTDVGTVARIANVAELEDGRLLVVATGVRRITGDPDGIGWQLCDMAPLASLDLQRLLVADGLEPRMRLLVDLCDAMSGDVIGLLSGGETGESADPA